jgi:ACS family hexuronate transporter-like MFS transporter
LSKEANLTPASPTRGPVWTWWVCGLLLLATMVNYMDRLTINLLAVPIKAELGLDNTHYGWVESGFGLAFGFGALVMGRVADRWNVRWVYPLALLGWSAAGFVTGFARTALQLLLCRIALGFFESGHWPCALRTTQRILPPAQRTLGNSLLQSGAALGSILTPLVVIALVRGPGTWPYPFFAIGAAGSLWAVVWLASVRREDLAVPPDADRGRPDAPGATPVWDLLRDRRFWILVVMVIMINQTWHFFRVWLPLFLQENHGYDRDFTNWFLTAYYLATDAGSLAAGFLTLGLARRGWSVHASRVLTFALFTVLTCSSLVVAFLPRGNLLLGLLLVVGFGSLGLFPAYYSLSQELTVRHQGKLSGMLGFSSWLAFAAVQPAVGAWVDATRNWTLVQTLAGLPPLIALAVLVGLWPRPAAEGGQAPSP